MNSFAVYNLAGISVASWGLRGARFLILNHQPATRNRMAQEFKLKASPKIKTPNMGDFKHELVAMQGLEPRTLRI